MHWLLLHKTKQNKPVLCDVGTVIKNIRPEMLLKYQICSLLSILNTCANSRSYQQTNILRKLIPASLYIAINMLRGENPFQSLRIIIETPHFLNSFSMLSSSYWYFTNNNLSCLHHVYDCYKYSNILISTLMKQCRQE